VIFNGVTSEREIISIFVRKTGNFGEYGVPNTTQDTNKLYLYLPAGETSIFTLLGGNRGEGYGAIYSAPEVEVQANNDNVITVNYG
jgi:hypothetical protein